MDDIFDKYAKLREEYPEDIERIEAEEREVSALLLRQEYYQNPETQKLIALCRKDIVTARMKLATERKLSDEARADLWLIIEGRSWFLSMVVKDYEAELAQIEQQLEADLSR